MKRYAICRHGNKITVKRTDRDYDFGEVINERDTMPEARLCAKVERMALKRYLSDIPDLDSVDSQKQVVGGKDASRSHVFRIGEQ